MSVDSVRGAAAPLDVALVEPVLERGIPKAESDPA